MPPFSIRLKPIVIAMTLIIGSSVQAIHNLAQAEVSNKQPMVDAQSIQQFDIAAGTLGSVLANFAAKAGILLSSEAHLTNTKNSQGLKGRYTIDSGLKAILANSGLTYRYTSSNTVVLEASSGAAEADTSVELAHILVTADSDTETPWSVINSVVAKRNASGTKTDSAIIETPQSISVVTNVELRDRQAETLSQALSYTPGFTSQPTSFNRTSDRFRIRGFDVESATGGSLKDGMRLQNNSYDGVQEPYALERVEVIRGAASVLYGQLSPGGMVNGVSKRPIKYDLREVNLQLGEHDRKQVSADFSGLVADSDALSYRLTMLKRDSDTSQDHINDDKVYIAPALTWQPNEDTSLTLLSFYQKTDTRFSAPLPYQLVKGLTTGNFEIGSHDFIGEPDYDEMTSEMASIGYEFKHAFNDHIRLNHKLRYYEADVKWNYLQAQTSAAAVNAATSTGILARQYSDRRERSRGLASDTNIAFDVKTGGVEHQFLVGFDIYDTSYDSHNFRAAAPSLDLSSYNYGQSFTVNRDPNFDRGSQTETLQRGIYLQDKLTFQDKWVMLLGVRHDWAEQDLEVNRTGIKSEQNNEATTGRAGLVYLADNGLAPYISYSESFFPVSVADAGGERFQPTEGQQYEAGIRYQPKGRNILLSAAVYELTQTNVLKYDIANDDYRQTGEVRSRGFELEAKADVTPELSVIASYAYTDARTTKSTIASEIGQRSEDTPYHQAALWAGYNMIYFGLPKLTLGGGMRYKGTTQASGIESNIPSYILFDAMARYEINQNWELAVNASNLTNKKYNYCEFAICRYGDERMVTGTLSYNW